jgi:hypothetical protein
VKGRRRGLTLMSSKNSPCRYGAVLFRVPDLVVICRVMPVAVDDDWAAALEARHSSVPRTVDKCTIVPLRSVSAVGGSQMTFCWKALYTSPNPGQSPWID